ncbi:hypothetical protein RFI_38602 [Reticulomyxa filosa]|uniref:Uncharacterized protein n=1 Tax=Reticulomyxa filosa TaxID=46433 RepID=X6LC39_RETFI|nr:hypothetical protein RFI_38602 [Reticulomyxa filosa]|eukprot:ETN98885.1 hypothetical protein RFI_38602 [Reticulomyxa filosa]
MTEERLKHESEVFEEAKKFAQGQEFHRREGENGGNVAEEGKIRAIYCIQALEQKIQEAKREIQRIENRASNDERNGDSEAALAARQEELAEYLQIYQKKNILKKFTSNTKEFVKSCEEINKNIDKAWKCCQGRRRAWFDVF